MFRGIFSLKKYVYKNQPAVSTIHADASGVSIKPRLLREDLRVYRDGGQEQCKSGPGRQPYPSRRISDIYEPGFPARHPSSENQTRAPSFSHYIRALYLTYLGCWYLGTWGFRYTARMLWYYATVHLKTTTCILWF